MSIPYKHIENLLKDFNFYELDKLSHKLDTNLNKVIYSAVSTVWWKDHNSALNILKNLPEETEDTLYIFLQALSYISCGKLTIFNSFFTQLKAKQNVPSWQKEWLEIEYLGRTYQEKKQINYIKKIYKKNQKLDKCIIGATIDSLMNKKANLSYVKNFTLTLLNNKQTNDNIYALASICGLIKNVEKEYNSFSSLFLANYFAAEKINPLESLQLYDNLASTMNFDINALNKWFELSTILPQAIDSNLNRLNYAYTNSTNLTIKGIIATYLVIYFFKKGDYPTVYTIIQKHLFFTELQTNGSINNLKSYFIYIYKLCLVWQNNKQFFNKNQNKLHVFGESHSLSLCNIDIQLLNKNYTTINYLIPGLKQYHLSSKNNWLKDALQMHLTNLNDGEDLLFTIGEIDTRQNEGIWKVYSEKKVDLTELIDKTLLNYIDFIYTYTQNKKLGTITIQGIPAPNYELDNNLVHNQELFLNMFKYINQELQKLVFGKGWYFLDVYNATVSPDGTSNKKWHIDEYHLTPLFYTQADKWLIKPT